MNYTARTAVQQNFQLLNNQFPLRYTAPRKIITYT